MTLVVHNQFVSNLIRSIYNNPANSDVILIFNDVKYHLILAFVQQHAPCLYEDFVNQRKSNSDIAPNLTPEQVIDSISSIISRSNKTTVIICNQAIDSDYLESVLKSMYGKTVYTPIKKLGAYYWLSVRFGMNALANRCIDLFKSALNLDTLAEDYLKAIKEKSLAEDLFSIQFIEHLDKIPKEKLLELAPMLKYEVILDLIRKNKSTNPDVIDNMVSTWSQDKPTNPDFIYNLIDVWAKNHSNEDQKKTLFSSLRLELLSLNLLLTKVKSNPYITPDKYIKAVEENALIYPKINIKEWAELNNKKWGSDASAYIGNIGRLDLLQLARLNGCEWDHWTCTWGLQIKAI